jgi:hypothetical protein
MGSKRGFNIASDVEQTKIMTEIMELRKVSSLEVKPILTQIRCGKNAVLTTWELEKHAQETT